MRRVLFSMGVSLDGYVVGPDGGFAFTRPDAEVFRDEVDQLREVGVHLLGRRLHETMRFWETVDPATLDDDERVWAELWAPLPKVVFSRTLTSVEGSSRLAAGSLAEEVARWQAEPGDGDIAIGGATLAAEAAALGLVDEYRLRLHPALVGGGIPFAPLHRPQTDLELLSSRTFASGVVQLRYRVLR